MLKMALTKLNLGFNIKKWKEIAINKDKMCEKYDGMKGNVTHMLKTARSVTFNFIVALTDTVIHLRAIVLHYKC